MRTNLAGKEAPIAGHCTKDPIHPCKTHSQEGYYGIGRYCCVAMPTSAIPDFSCSLGNLSEMMRT